MARDLVCSIVLAAVAATYYVMARGIGSSALADEVGASGLPIIYAMMLAGIALLMALSVASRAVRQRAVRGGAAAGPDLAFVMRRAGGVLGIGVGYVLIVGFVGYFLALAVVLGAMLTYQGERFSRRVVLIAFGGAGIFWVLFDRLLGIPMPTLWGL